LSQALGSVEDRLRRSTAAGKNSAETVSARVDGQGRLNVEIDAAAFGLDDKGKIALENAVAEAANAALAKQRRRVSKEIGKLVNNG